MLSNMSFLLSSAHFQDAVIFFVVQKKKKKKSELCLKILSNKVKIEYFSVVLVMTYGKENRP